MERNGMKKKRSKNDALLCVFVQNAYGNHCYGQKKEYKSF